MLTRLDAVHKDLVSWATSDIPRVRTGYQFIDEPTGGGPAPGELVMFIARPGVGKTFWALNVCAHNPDTPTIFFTLEMHGRYLLKRFAAIHTNTPTAHIERTLIDSGSSPAVDQTVFDFPKLAFWDQPGIGLAELHQACADYADEYDEKPKLVVIDFLELLRSFGMTETESVKRMAMELKNFAREEDTVVMVLHQVSRGAQVKRQGSDRAVVDEGHRPLSKGSAAYGGEYSADYMVGAFRPGLDPEASPQWREILKNDFRLQFLKSRGDYEFAPDPVRHHWDPATGRIIELDMSIYSEREVVW